MSLSNLELHFINVTPKLVRKVITNLDLPKASGLDCIPAVVLKKCESELSYILAVSPGCLVSFVVHVFKNVGKRYNTKNYCPVRSGATRVVALGKSKAFDRFAILVFIDKLKAYGISSLVLDFISSLFNNRWLRVVLDGKSSEEYPVIHFFLPKLLFISINLQLGLAWNTAVMSGLVFLVVT